MTINEYQALIHETAVFPREQVGLAYCALGLNGEAGEVAEKIKKLYRDKSTMVDGEIILSIDSSTDIPAIKKELGDVLWYVTATANMLGITLEDIMQTNYDKLMARRATNTLHGSGDDREVI